MFFSLGEVIQALIISAALGFMFQDVFSKPRDENFDPLRDARRKRFRVEDFLFAVCVTAPAVVLHELGHKFVALAFGATAQFSASFGGLALGIFLKLVNSPFIFFVPAYVSISSIPNLEASFVALAGPLVNLLIFVVSTLLLRYRKFSRSTNLAIALTRRINLLLFIFNMLPLPGFDGFHFIASLISVLMGR